MKNNCCSILTILLIIVISIQIYTVRQIKKTNNPAVVTTISPTIIPQPTISTNPTATPTVAEDQLLVEVNNISACSFTNKAEFTLPKDYLITRFRTWYSWEKGETEIPYKLLKDDKEIASGVLTRKDCDPYQTQWCIAADFNFQKNLSAGNYVLQLTKSRICQNVGSQGKGFIYVWGK